MKNQIRTTSSPRLAPTLHAQTVPQGMGVERSCLPQFASLPDEVASTINTLRHNVLALVEQPDMFTDTERLRTNDSVYQCDCVAQLQHWFRNVYRVYEQRIAALQLCLVDGSSVLMAIAA
jgi:hypothetical protein